MLFTKLTFLNDYEFKSLSPTITDKNVYVYDTDIQSNRYFYAPFIVEFNG